MKVSLLLLSTLLLTVGCEQAQQAKDSYDTLSQINKIGKNAKVNLEEAQTQSEERKQRGDTISLPYKDLQQYLPASPGGYSAGEPSGESMKAGRIAFSTASQEFRNGEARLDVSLTDYNGAQDLYQGAAAMFALGLEQENDEQMLRPTQLRMDGVKGMETFHKKDGRAELLLTVGGRFLIKIEATEQKSLDFVQDVARKMQLEKLAQM
ncbi:hypothetical protein [Hymenobacter psychrophilus]|uniref:Lipoprotein n=1 Tax=Hymenobacter psychrophilus TaxID=651662 RepID=A0A1H3CVS2_9BACT|nr:hypothetical protein [Hymenobacter psychrophilus]SDX58293.1 hypothetical protein SAMN04488069_102134 [Hymenobacter psychrophilus]